MGQMDVEGNKEVVRRLLGNLGTGNMEAVAEDLADDVTWIIPGLPEVFPLAGTRNKAEFLELYRDFAKLFPGGLEFKIKGMTAEGSRVAVEAESRGESIAGTFHNRYHFLFELRDGKVVVGKEYADSAYMKAFQGRLEATPS